MRPHVVLATLVVQGLSLPALSRALRLEADDREEAAGLVRVRSAEAALARLEPPCVAKAASGIST